VRTALAVTPGVLFVAWCSTVRFRSRRRRIGSPQGTGDRTL
jgi:hypothetical protein